MDFLDTRKQLEIRIIKKAREDKEFEKLMFSDPAKALDSLGVKVPEGYSLKVIQEKKGELILAYPVINSQEELNELELINAAGGCGGGGTQLLASGEVVSAGGSANTGLVA